MLPTYELHPYRPGTRVQRPPVPLNEYDVPPQKQFLDTLDEKD